MTAACELAFAVGSVCVFVCVGFKESDVFKQHLMVLKLPAHTW